MSSSIALLSGKTRALKVVLDTTPRRVAGIRGGGGEGGLGETSGGEGNGGRGGIGREGGGDIGLKEFVEMKSLKVTKRSYGVK